MKKILFYIFVVLYMPVLMAQVPDIIVGEDYRGTTFREFTNLLENKYPVHFYFNPELVDTLILDYPEGISKLDEILRYAFRDKELFYFIDTEGNVIFTSRRPVEKELLSNFFDVPEEFIKKPAITDLEDKSLDGGVVSGEENNGNGIINIGKVSQRREGDQATLTGNVKEAENGEPLIGAVVYVDDLELGMVTDLSGYYALTIPRGRHFITYHSLGKKDVRHQVLLNADGNLNIELTDKITQLRGVEVIADRDRNVAGLQVGLARVDIKTIKELPAALGEVDVVKAALLLPGVQTVGEGASGFNVRGGNTDQNLFLINEAPVFNTSHLFGFFSVFNPDVINDFKLYKSGIPAQYGGRISSVFDITTKTGNKKRFSGNGGISPVTGRLCFEGPVIKDKLSFIVGGRTTYSDWILNRLKNPAFRNSNASFYDLNARINYEINQKNSIDLSGYYSHDFFRLNSDTTYNYINRNISLSWKHLFSEKLIGVISGIYSNYNYLISSRSKPVSAFELRSDIYYREFKTDFTWFPRYNQKVNFGLSAISYLLNPADFRGLGEESIISPLNLENERALESSLYISDEYSISPRISLYGGIRLSSFFYLGPKTVYTYYDALPREGFNIKDTTTYGSGKIIQPYAGPELRFSLRYRLGSSNSLKISYNKMRQYLHMMSNTTAISPTDTWKLSDPHIKPQVGDQVALGYYHDFHQNTIETSAEVYYKNISNIIEYKGGAELFLNEIIETDLINAKGRAYGFELMVKKKAGMLTGWVGYTYSRIFIKADGRFASEKINNGEYYPANYDKPHDLTIVGNYRFSRRFSVSSNFTYSTGRPITYPVAKYKFRNNMLLHYSERNEYRIPDYVRLDFSLNLEGNLKLKKLAHSSWSLSIYNATGRDNVYSIYFISQEKKVSGYKLSIFSQPIFTLTYNFRF